MPTENHPSHRIALVLARSVAAAMLLAAMLSITVMAKDPPVTVTSAAANSTLSELSIQGANFGSAEPKVFLAGVPLQVLFWSPTSISANLPAGVQPGSYPLVVVRTSESNGKSVKKSAKAQLKASGWLDVTLGAVGPEGIPGETGATGSDGAPGAPGATGTAGTDGNDGAAGATGSAGVTGATGTNGATGPPGLVAALGTSCPAGLVVVGINLNGTLACTSPGPPPGPPPAYQPAGLTPGDTYRLVFVTTGQRTAVSPDINDYNTFVDGFGETLIPGHDWRAIGSTALVDARDNTRTVPGSDPLGFVGIYRVDGVKVAASYTALWNVSPSHTAPFNQNEFGTPVPPDNEVWTGTARFTSGLAHPDFPLGNVTSNLSIYGKPSDVNTSWIQRGAATATQEKSFYAMSQVLVAE